MLTGVNSTIVSGQTVPGAIVGADVDQYQVTIPAGGGTISLALSETTPSSSFTPQVDIYDPSGGWVDGNWNYSSVSLTHYVSTSGTYRVAVKDYNGAGGSVPYNLTTAVLPGTQQVGVDDGPITSGQTKSGTMVNGDIDIFTVTVPSGGGTISLALAETTPSSSFTPKVDIYSPSGTLVDGNWDYTSVPLVHYVSTSGTYYVVVKDYNGAGGGVPYNLTAAVLPGTQQFGVDDGLIASGQTKTATMSDGDIDIFTVTVPSGGGTINLSLAEISPNSAFTPKVDIYSPSGTLVDGNWDYTSVPLVHYVSTSGTYYVVVKDYNGFGGGVTYNLTAAVLPGTQQFGTDDGPIASGQTKTATMANADIDIFTVSVPSGGGTISLALSEISPNSGFTPRVYLYSPSGTWVDDNWDYSSVPLVHYVSTSGTYYVVVKDYNALGDGVTYNLTAAVLPGAQQFGADDGPIASGQTKTATMSDGDIDIFTVAVPNGGGTISLSLSKTPSASFTPRIFLYSPSGIRVDDNWSYNNTFTLSDHVTTPGTYYVVVKDYDGGGGGIGYTLTNTSPLFADVVLDYFDSGTGTMPWPYGGTSSSATSPVPVSVDVAVDQDDQSALSLPTGSFVTVGFSGRDLFDGPGADFGIVEDSPSGERADVYVSSGTSNFVLIGQALDGQITSFDLASIGWTGKVRSIKVVGKDLLGSWPGFDLGGVIASATSIESDTTPPGPVTSLTATPSNQRVDLSWSNPSGSNLAGVLIVRCAGQAPSAGPTQGLTYSVDDSLGGGTVIFSGSGNSIHDTPLTNGTTYFYAVYTYDMWKRYSAAASTSAKPQAVIPDNAPTATFGSLLTTIIEGGTVAQFTVVYSDDTSVNIASIDNADIKVGLPNATQVTATRVSVIPNSNGTPRTATYQFTAPDGTWDPGDNGTYTVILQGNQVFDTTGHAATGKSLGTFAVSLGQTYTGDALFEVLARDVAYSTWTVSADAGNGYVVNAVFNDVSTGFYAVGLTSAQNGPALVIRGTEPTHINDVLADLSPQGVGYNQFIANRSLVETWLNGVTTGSIVPDIVGHSLGGALAQWFAADYTSSQNIFGQGRQLDDIVTFNSPGISAAYASRFQPSKAHDVMHYITSGDMVSMAGDAFIAGAYTLSSFSDSGVSGLIHKHLEPVIVDHAHGYDKPAGIEQTVFNSVAHLNDPWFMYVDVDYFKVLAAAEIVTAVALPNYADVPPALLFRSTTEDIRQRIGLYWDEIQSQLNLSISATSAHVKLPDVSLNFLGLLTLDATDLSLTYQSNPEKFKIQGQVSLPAVYNATANFSGNNFIEVRDDGWDAVGTLSIGNANIVSGVWGIKSASLSFNTQEHSVSAQGTIVIPTGIELAASIDFLAGQINGATISVDGLNVAIGATGAFLQSLGGGVSHLAQTDPASPSLLGSVGITYGPEKTVVLPGWAGGSFQGSLASADVSGTIDANHLQSSGQFNFLGGVISGTGDLDLNWTPGGILRADGQITALGGIVTGNASLTADRRLNVTVNGTASVTVPSIIPVFGGHTLGSGGMLVKYTNNSSLSDDFAAAWGSVYIPLWGPIQAGIRVFFDGTYSKLSPGAISELSSVTSFSDAKAPGASWASVAAATNSAGFTVEPDAPFALFSLSWDTPDPNAKIQLIDPNGDTYSEADITGSPSMAIVPDLTDSTHRTVVVIAPAAGLWRIEMVNSAGHGLISPAALVGSDPPTLAVTDVSSQLGTSVQIKYNATDFDPQTPVSFYYDSSPSGYQGTLIANSQIDADGPANYVWDVADVPAGSYYIYAIASDSQHVPVFSDYSDQPVQVYDHAIIRPEASDDSVTTNEDTPIAVTALANDSDIFGTIDPSSVAVDSGPSHGNAVADPQTGSILYTPASNFYGTDSFTYTVSDSLDAVSNQATVSVTINPIADSPSVTGSTTVEDTQTSTGLVITGNEVDNGGVAFFKITSIIGGTIFQHDGSTPIADGSFITAAQGAAGLRFTPGANLHSPNVSFGFSAQASLMDGDSGLGGNAVTAAITVSAVNDPPTLTAVSALTGGTEDTTLTITYAMLATAANETDADGDALSFRIESVSIGTLTKNGSLVTPGTTLLGLGESLLWTPALNANSTLTAFTIKAYDGLLASSTAVAVRVQVAPVNDAPILTAISTLTGATEDTGFHITYASLLAAADLTDVDGNTPSFRVESVTTGILTKNGSSVTPGGTLLSTGEELVWTPAANAFGTITPFTVKAFDGVIFSSTAVGVPVAVAAVNDPPNLTTVTTLSGAIVNRPFIISYEMLAGAADETDIDNNSVSFRIESISSGSLAKNGSAVVPGATVIGPDESITWTPPGNTSSLRLAFRITAFDGQDGSGSPIGVSVNIRAGYDLIAWFDSLPNSVSRSKPKPMKAVIFISNTGTLPVTKGAKITVQLFLVNDNGYQWPLPTPQNQSVSGLAPGRSKKISKTVKLMSGLAPGSYRIVAVVDPQNSIGELDGDNNTADSHVFNVV